MKTQLQILMVLFLFCSFGLKAQDNVVINGDFADGQTAWTVWHADWEPWIDYDIVVADGWFNVENLVIGEVEYWYLQVNQELTADQINGLEVGSEYTLTFTAKAEAAKELKVFFGENGGGFTDLLPENTPGVGHLVNLNTSEQDVSINFNVSETFAAMKLGFEGGMGDVGFSISNVSLVKDVANSFNDASINNVEVYSSNGKVSIEADAGSKIEIYNITGILLGEAVSTGGTTTIDVPANSGVVLVKVDDAPTQKLLVK